MVNLIWVFEMAICRFYHKMRYAKWVLLAYSLPPDEQNIPWSDCIEVQGDLSIAVGSPFHS